MPSLLTHLSAAEQRALLADMNYLNMGEFRGFCDRHGIPYRICIAFADGRVRKTKDTDRKAIVLERIRRYLKTGRAPGPTCFPEAIVRDGPPRKSLRASDRLYYGTYDKHDPVMVGLLQRLTGGAFRNGAVARIVARDFWMRGEAPTFAAYAKAWTAESEDPRPHPEAAFLTDRSRGEAGADWKRKRVAKAKQVLRVLKSIEPPA